MTEADPGAADTGDLEPASHTSGSHGKQERDMKSVSVIGAGYVGLVTGACLAELGHVVTCVEIDPVRLSLLNQGALPFHEPGLDDLVQRNIEADRLAFTNDYAEAIPGSEFVFIAVPTPPRENGEAETSYVMAAARSILEYAQPGLIIVVKSTVPPGTGDAVERLLGDLSFRGIDVVSNPEFLREGRAIQDFMNPDRIVVGSSHPVAGEAVARLYGPLDAEIIYCSRRSAELGKYAANALLATRISFMNEVSTICEEVRADVKEVASIVGSDHRIGHEFLGAGLGWGGSCFPKDVRALAATAANHGLEASILQAVFDVNDRRREEAVNHLCSAVELAHEPTVGVLGLAFKPDTDDIRDAPALHVIERLCERGIRVRAHDPVAVSNAQRVCPDITYCEDGYQVARGCDAILLATPWNEYLALDWERVFRLMRGDVILDGRNMLNGAWLAMIGFRYLSFGRSALLSRDPRQMAQGERVAGVS